MSEIRISIDGKVLVARKSQTILEVAHANGIEIPTLCYDERITKNTSCFVCVVKDKKTGRWLPSCSSLAEAGMELESESPEVKDMRKTALALLLSEHTGDCEAPCTLACPAHAQVEEYVREAKKGNHRESLKLIKERIPLPMSIGRVCPRFCEKDCRRNVLDQAVAINDCKRLAADLHYDEYMEEMEELTGKRIAIVGSGPGGLAAAYFLRRMGIASDIYEKMPKAGGMLRYGIPEYRLPKKILAKELAHFDKMGGIKICCGKELGRDIQLDELKANYDAVVVAVGCWQSSSMRTEGEELAHGGIKWLEQLACNGWQGDDPGETIVVGGGNTAMDCVRSALRLTDKPVHCFYRRTEKEMPAEQIEIDEAKEEGARFAFLTLPVRLRKEGEKLVLTCVKMELGEPDASGRRRPIPIEGSEFEVEADTVIAAIGQKTVAPQSIPTNKWGDVAVDEKDCRVEDNIFAVGDCVSGPATVVEAVAGGRKAALAIEAFLNNKACEDEYLINVSRGHWQSLKQNDLVFLKEPVGEDRVALRLIDLEIRKNTFQEVSCTFTEDEVKREGERCIECSCTARDDCNLKKHSQLYLAVPDTFQGEKIKHKYDTRHPEIIMDPGKCIKCGICVKICSDVIEKYLLGFKFRGYFTRVGTSFERPLPQDCKECGECIEACPVGALDWKNKE